MKSRDSVPSSLTRALAGAIASLLIIVLLREKGIRTGINKLYDLRKLIEYDHPKYKTPIKAVKKLSKLMDNNIQLHE